MLQQAIHDHRDGLLRLVADRCRHARGVHTERDSSAEEVHTLAINGRPDRIRGELADEGNSPGASLLIIRVEICSLTLPTLEEQAGREYPRSPGNVPAFDEDVEHAHRRFERAVIDWLG